MEKKFLEDIKVNKSKKINSLEKEAFVSQNMEVKYFNNYQGDIKESKVDEYLKNQSTKGSRIQRTPQLKKNKIIIHKSLIWTFCILLIMTIIYFGGIYYEKANIEITSKHQSILYNNKSFNASKEEKSNLIDFEIMIVPDKKSKTFILTEPKNVSIKSTGLVTLYNEFSTTPQKILAGTFLVDTLGKSYKTNEVVVIPGYKLDTNKKIIPGQIDVNISSFLPGEAYNGSPQDFYLTSFKGTIKYNKIYAKLKKPLLGGISGTVYTLSDLDKEQINTLAESSFKNDLFEKVKALVPEGYILYPDAMTFSYDVGENTMSKDLEAEVLIDGKLTVVLLEEKSLMKNIITVSLPEIKGDELNEISILNLDKLVFNFNDKNQLITKDINSISFSFTGGVDALWTPDIESLKIKLLGVHKNKVLEVFRQDPGISSALVKIFPPWQKYIPTELFKINILLK